MNAELKDRLDRIKKNPNFQHVERCGFINRTYAFDKVAPEGEEHICYQPAMTNRGEGAKFGMNPQDDFRRLGWTDDEFVRYVKFFAACHPAFPAMCKDTTPDNPYIILDSDNPMIRYHAVCMFRALWESPYAAAIGLHLFENTECTPRRAQLLMSFWMHRGNIHWHLGGHEHCIGVTEDEWNERLDEPKPQGTAFKTFGIGGGWFCDLEGHTSFGKVMQDIQKKFNVNVAEEAVAEDEEAREYVFKNIFARA